MIRNQKGFTLIELMVVVLIIGILVAVAIPVFGSAANNAKNKACQANVRTLAGAVAQYNAEYSKYPTAIDMAQLGNFMKAIPEDPHDDSLLYSVNASGEVSAADHSGIAGAVQPDPM